MAHSLPSGFGMASSLPPSRAPPSTLEQALPRLAQETELQKMLTDEKMRSEQHKVNYQTLKAEHTRLQDEYVQLQNEMKSTIEESRLVGEKYKTLLDQTRQELSAKHAQLEDMKCQVPNSQKMDLMRMQLAEEVEEPYREKFHKLNTEVDAYRTELNKLKYEHSFLKSEYEHEQEENQRVIKEMKMRHEAEVTNLRKERETIIARQQGEPSSDSQRVRVLQRENAQLHLKVKGLLTELEEIRAQREHLGMQSDHVSRLQNKQLQEHTANIRALETEKDSLRLQVDTLQKELGSTSELHTELTGKVHTLEKENIMLRNRAEEVTHKSKVEITNIKMEMLKERGDLERDRDRMLNHIEDLKSELEIAKHSCDQQAAALVEKERESVKRVQAAREEEWTKLHKVENDKLELESKLQEIERRKIDEESQRHAEGEKMEERLRVAMEAKDAAERELLVVKTKLQHLESLTDQLDRERSENSELKTKLHKVESTYNAYVSNEQELVELNSKLKHQLELAYDDLRKAKSTAEKTRYEADKIIAQHRAAWSEEKVELQRRVDDIESQLAQLHTQLSQTISTHKKKKKKYIKVNTDLRNKFRLLKARVEQLSTERDVLKKSIPAEDPQILKKQFRELLRRHKDFRAVLLSTCVDQVPIGELSFATASMPYDNAPSGTGLGFLESETQHEKELDLLKQRLDSLDNQQQSQMAELRGISKVITNTTARTSKNLRISTDEDSVDNKSD